MTAGLVSHKSGPKPIRKRGNHSYDILAIATSAGVFYQPPLESLPQLTTDN